MDGIATASTGFCSSFCKSSLQLTGSKRKKKKWNADLQISVFSTDDHITKLLLLPVIVHEVENSLCTCHVLGVIHHSWLVFVSQQRRQRIAVRFRVNRRVHRDNDDKFVPRTDCIRNLSKYIKTKVVLPCSMRWEVNEFWNHSRQWTSWLFWSNSWTAWHNHTLPVP